MMWRGSSTAMFLFVLLFGCLALPSLCRPHQLQQMESTPNTIEYSAHKSDNGSKVYLNFCISGYCSFFGGGMKRCYCCKNFGPPKENCHQTEEECRATCIACNPKCPPQLGIVDGASK